MTLVTRPAAYRRMRRVGVRGALVLSLVGMCAGAGSGGDLHSAQPLRDGATQPVRYFDAAAVAAAFAKGGVLFDGAGANYMVHASRREAPGRVEVHARDVDVILVLAGTATFVTGGTLLDGETVAPDELRGDTLQGGAERQLAKGDVVIVPAGTPHWFKAVPGPLEYFVVKVR